MTTDYVLKKCSLRRCTQLICTNCGISAQEYSDKKCDKCGYNFLINHYFPKRRVLLYLRSIVSSKNILVVASFVSAGIFYYKR
jgi:uncharacterized membrane protein YvbJ